jgi:hypothetical protein
MIVTGLGATPPPPSLGGWVAGDCGVGPLTGGLIVFAGSTQR